MGRETAVDPLEWTADGWPMINRLNGPSCLQKKFLADVPVQSSETWICPRLSPESFSCLETDGSISLQGGAELSNLYDVHLLLHRLREADVELEAGVDLQFMETGSMAGLTGYYDERSYFLLGIRKTVQGAEVVLDQRIGRALYDDAFACRRLKDPTDNGVFGSDFGDLAKNPVDKGFVQNVGTKTGTVIDINMKELILLRTLQMGSGVEGEMSAL